MNYEMRPSISIYIYILFLANHEPNKSAKIVLLDALDFYCH
jgi:hypothetical protein